MSRRAHRTLRRFQAAKKRRPKLPFDVRPSGIHGRGAYAVVPIARGTRIIEYKGERITHEEADARYDDDAMVHHHTFLMMVNRELVIDAAVGGNEARFINHSCAPNCRLAIEGGRVYIDALRKIEPGEELAYDYAYRREKGDDAFATTRYACRCGSEACRGTLLAPESGMGSRGSPTG